MINLTKYGVHDVSINGVKSKCIYLPKPPKDEKDIFLATFYASSFKPTTYNNMYSKWLNAVRQRLNKYKGDMLDTKCQILIINFDTNDEQLTPYALTTSIQCITRSIVSDERNMSIITFKTIQSELECLLIFINSIDDGILYISEDDLKSMVSEIDYNV